MIAVDLLSEIFILIVLGIYLKRNNVIDGHTVDQLTDLIVKIWYTHIQLWYTHIQLWYTHIQFWDMKKIELSAYICYYISRRIFYGKIG